MKSMTGYGKGEAENSQKRISIELKSVNNRYLEITSRIPKSFSYIDEVVRKYVQKNLKRGGVEIMFSYVTLAEGGKNLEIDYTLAEKYVAIAKEVEAKFAVSNDIGVSRLLQLPEVMTLVQAEDDKESILELVKEATVKAVEGLEKMRLVEGETVKEDFTKMLTKMEGILVEIIKRAPSVVEEYTAKLRKRITELCQDVAVDEARLANEVAHFADKCDINEEISRLQSHFKQFYATMESDDVHGRRLDFLSQEIHREINTMGSKANDLTLTNMVIELKNELEKIREQVRNVE